MYLPDDWSYEDLVTGLTIKTIPGIALDRLQILVREPERQGNWDNRDFFFTRTGEFDGTGSSLTDKQCAGMERGVTP